MAVGNATPVRNRKTDCVIESLPSAHLISRRDFKFRRSWKESIELSPAFREEIRWWLRNQCCVNGQAICPRPFSTRIDGYVFANASDTGAGAVVSVEGQEAAAPSVVQALRRMATPGKSRAHGASSLRDRGHDSVLSAGVGPQLHPEGLGAVRGAGLRHGRRLPSSGRIQAALDNFACIFIMGLTRAVWCTRLPPGARGSMSTSPVQVDHLTLRCRSWWLPWRVLSHAGCRAS